MDTIEPEPMFEANICHTNSAKGILTLEIHPKYLFCRIFYRKIASHFLRKALVGQTSIQKPTTSYQAL